MVLTLPPASWAEGMRDYIERNRDFFGPHGPPMPKGDEALTFWQQRLERNRDEFRDDQSARFVGALLDDPDRIPIATISFTQIARGVQCSCNLGYAIDSTLQGFGLMTEALQVLVRFMFEERGIHRIEASYAPTNERSGQLLRRLGFTVEGYSRDYLFLDGAWRDHVRTALVNPSPIYLP